MKLTFSRQEHALLLALLASLLLWSLPFGGFALYPFKLLSTWVHEMWHGVAMMLTGFGFSRLAIYQDTSGIAFARQAPHGPAVALIASAGYMGTSLLGSFLLVLSQRWHRSRTALVGLAAALGLSLFLWVENDFGQGAVALGGIAMLVMARFAPDPIAIFVANFVAAQACINAVLDIRVLFRPVHMIDGSIAQISDANAMATALFGPPAFWAGLWLVFSFACFYLALRFAHLRRGGPVDHAGGGGGAVVTSDAGWPGAGRKPASRSQR